MATAYYSIDSSKIDAGLTNFPVGIKIESSTGFMSGLGATDWQNLHATVGGTECYVEVEKWDDTSDVAVLWVRVPTVSSSSNTVIKVETGASNTSYVGETSDTAAQNVWDSNFVAVYHLAQDPSGGTGCILDSTANENHGTPGYYSYMSLVDGHFNKGIKFTSYRNYINCGNDASLNGIKTWMLSFFDVAYHSYSNYAGLISKHVSVSYRAIIALDATNNSPYLFNSPSTSVHPTADYKETESWHSIAFTNDETDQEIFIDGQSDNTAENLMSTSDVDGGTLYLGNYMYSDLVHGLSGDSILSNIMLSDVVRSDAWIKATYNVLNDSLLTYSATDPSAAATEPDLMGQGVGLSESLGANVEKIAGIVAGLGLHAILDGQTEGLTEQGLDEGIALGETIGRNVERVRGITAGLGLQGVAGLHDEGSRVLAGLGLGEDIGASVELSRGFSAGLFLGESTGALNYSAWLRANKHLALYRYYSRLTGDADGLADYEFPGLKSFQFRMRSGFPSYLSLALVYTSALVSAISARSNGEIVLDMAAVVNGVESLREELIRTPFYSIRYDLGAASRSITLVGYQTRDYGGTRVELKDVTTETMMADGRMRFRCARPDFYLRPGDTAVHGAHEITVDSVSCMVGANAQSMDVSE